MRSVSQRLAFFLLRNVLYLCKSCNLCNYSPYLLFFFLVSFIQPENHGKREWRLHSFDNYIEAFVFFFVIIANKSAYYCKSLLTEKKSSHSFMRFVLVYWWGN